MKLMMMMMIERTVRAPLGQHQGKTLLAEVPGVLAVPLLEHHGRHLRGVLGQGRNIPAKCQDEDNDEKIWDGDGNSDVDDEAINDDYKDEDKEDNNYDRATCRRGGPGRQRLPPQLEVAQYRVCTRQV